VWCSCPCGHDPDGIRAHALHRHPASHALVYVLCLLPEVSEMENNSIRCLLFNNVLVDAINAFDVYYFKTFLFLMAPGNSEKFHFGLKFRVTCMS